MKIPFLQWILENPIPVQMTYRRRAEIQREEIAKLVEIGEIFVVGTHRSKSIVHPVLLIEASILGLKIWVRDNFHNHAVTVESTHPLSYTQYAIDFSGVDSVYFEGFEDAGAPVYPVSTETRASFYYHGAELGEILRHIAGQATKTQFEASDRERKKAAALAWQQQLDSNEKSQSIFLSCKTMSARDEVFDFLTQSDLGDITLTKGKFRPDIIVELKGISAEEINSADFVATIKRLAEERGLVVTVKNSTQMTPFIPSMVDINDVNAPAGDTRTTSTQQAGGDVTNKVFPLLNQAFVGSIRITLGEMAPLYVLLAMQSISHVVHTEVSRKHTKGPLMLNAEGLSVIGSHIPIAIVTREEMLHEIMKRTELDEAKATFLYDAVLVIGLTVPTAIPGINVTYADQNGRRDLHIVLVSGTTQEGNNQD